MTRPRIHTRRTRHGVELRVDGTLASLIKPGGGSSGPVWDAIAAPLLALPAGRLRRLLILGFGGGSVARVARTLAPEVEIVGVDLDPDVIRVAREELGAGELGAEIHVEDAVSFLRRERRTFDAVVDDVFGGTPRTLRKPAAVLESYDLVRRRVARGGVLIANTIDETREVRRELERGAGTILEIAMGEYWNYILALGPATLEAGRLRARLRRHPLFAETLPQLALRTLRG